MPYSIANTLRFIGNCFPDVDFFIHTWEQNQYRIVSHESVGVELLAKSNNLTLVEAREEQRIINEKRIIDTYDILEIIKTTLGNNIKNIKVEKVDQYMFVREDFYNRYSWAESNNLKTKYEQQLNFKYDFVVKIRPDLLFPKEITLIREIDNCLKNNPDASFFSNNDVFYIGQSNVMDVAASFIHTDIDNRSLGPAFRAYINGNNIRSRRTIFNEFAIYRPETMPTSSLQFKKCKSIDDLWNYHRRNYRPYELHNLDEEN